MVGEVGRSLGFREHADFRDYLGPRWGWILRAYLKAGDVSGACSEAWRLFQRQTSEVNGMAYSERDKQRAAEIRNWIRLALGARCAMCGCDRDLEFDCITDQGHAHHGPMGYVKRQYFYREQFHAGNLQLLCQRCHVAKTHLDYGEEAALESTAWLFDEKVSNEYAKEVASCPF